MPSRMRIIYSNLKKCYPNWSDKKIKSFAFDSGARTIEMGAFVLASPYMSNSALKKRFTLSDSLKKHLEYYAQNPKPIVLLVPHFCMMEAITMLPMLNEGKTPNTGVFYRPMNSKAVDNWVLKTRSRFGLKLLSRNAGLTKAFDFLRDNGSVAVLFDQSVAAKVGILSYFFSRPCYGSNLAGLFVEKYKSEVGFMYAKRTGFFRAEINAHILDCKKDNISVMLAGNQMLEKVLREDEELSADWLWLHDRWKFVRKPNMLLNLKHPKDATQNQCIEVKRNKIFVNLPANKTEIEKCVDSIKNLALSRPDATITLLAKKELCDYVSSLNFADEVLPLPYKKGGIFKYNKAIKSLQNSYIDLLIELSCEAENEATCLKMKAFKSIALCLDDKDKKKGFSHSFCPSKEGNIYRNFLLNFGLDESL